MTPEKPGLYGWGGLAVLAVVWGSAFAFTRVAVTDLPPSLVAFGRLAVAAIALYAWMVFRRRHLPPLADRRWRWLFALGLFGNALPFTLIAYGQQYVPSGVAGILMGLTPLAIIAGAHFVLPNERLTVWKGAGFLIGFAGIVILTGPSALAGMLNTDFLAQLTILAGTLCYATHAITYQRAPEMAPSMVAAGSMIAATILALPAALFDLAGGTEIGWSAPSVGSVIVLGLLPTGLAGIVYMGIARHVGAAFIATINYIVPIVAAGIGLALGESLCWNAFAALIVILAGIAVARRGTQRGAPPSAPARR